MIKTSSPTIHKTDNLKQREISFEVEDFYTLQTNIVRRLLVKILRSQWN